MDMIFFLHILNTASPHHHFTVKTGLQKRRRYFPPSLFLKVTSSSCPKFLFVLEAEKSFC